MHTGVEKMLKNRRLHDGLINATTHTTSVKPK